MLTALTTAILPIFAVMAVGFAFARAGLADELAPAGINRFVLLIASPALLFSILSRAPIDAIDWGALGTYVAGEATVYLTGFLLARFLFRRGAVEAVLLGMAAAFVNHILFVLPVAQTLYGAPVATPIGAIVAFDSLVTFSGTVILLEAMTGRARRVRAVVARIALNPMLIGPALGIAVNLAGWTPHPGVMRFAGFTGAATAPAALFALGVTLSFSDLRRIGAASLSIAALAVAAHPALTWTFGGLRGPSDWQALMVLTAAGPCGAMPYALATFYGAPPRSIAKAIVVSSLISVFTLAALA